MTSGAITKGTLRFAEPGASSSDFTARVSSKSRAPMRNWKRGTNRFQHTEWQEGFFDHRLRTDSEVNNKWDYIRRNPVVKGLCATEDDWPWWWSAVVRNPLFKVDRP